MTLDIKPDSNLPTTQHIQAQTEAGVLILTLNRPDKMNALTEEMYGALAQQIDAAQTDADVRVVLLLAAGDAFTAGNDLSTFAALSRGPAVKSSADSGVQRFLHALAIAKKPLLAGVQGQAIGIGVTMLLHFDMVFIAHDAKLKAPFVNLALVPEAASTLLLVERIGHARAFALFAMGQTLDGDTAVALGIANKAVEKSRLREEALTAARYLATRPTGALVATKQLMRRQEAILAQIDAENEQFNQRLTSPEAKEVFKAFAEKRAPDFSSIKVDA